MTQRAIVAYRTHEKETTECCGCGNARYLIFIVVGRADHAASGVYAVDRLMLCTTCFKPLRAVVDIVQEPTTNGKGS